MTRVDQLIKEALLSKDKIALNAYKNIKTEFEKFKYAQKLPRNIDEVTALRIISNYAKKLEDAILQFSEAHRDDLVASYTSELEVVKKLLPEPVNESQIWSELAQFGLEKDWVNRAEFVNSTKLSQVIYIPKKEMGTAIKHLKSKFPTADGKMISEIVKQYLV